MQTHIPVDHHPPMHTAPPPRRAHPNWPMSSRTASSRLPNTLSADAHWAYSAPPSLLAAMLPGLSSDDGAAAGDGPPHDEGVHLPGAFVGVDRLRVGDVPADVVLQQD